ncbi:MAG: hypothetical protein KDD47_27065, partial [Acidobacteria bacterium]|nr:hypothetical protein [Acidobacteriota bacterium]
VLAGYIVSSNSPSCRPAGELGVRGGFCKGFQCPTGPDFAVDLDQLIRPLPDFASNPASESFTVHRRSA